MNGHNFAASLASVNLTAPDGASRAFHYRENSDGDKGVIQQVFGQSDYLTSTFPQHTALVRWYEAQPAPLILDLGANIGASVVYFALGWPKSLIVAVEPEQNNLNLLAHNVRGLATKVKWMLGGVSDGLPLFLTDPGRGDWAFRTQSVLVPGAKQVPSYTVPQLLRMHDTHKPFIVKIDIEGAEEAVFNNPLEAVWVARVPLIVIELHDWMLPGRATSRPFLRAIAAHNFDVVQRGENLFCFNNDLLREYAP